MGFSRQGYWSGLLSHITELPWNVLIQALFDRGSMLSLRLWLCFWMTLSAAVLASPSGWLIAAFYFHISVSQSPKWEQMSSCGRPRGGQSACLSQKCQNNLSECLTGVNWVRCPPLNQPQWMMDIGTYWFEPTRAHSRTEGGINSTKNNRAKDGGGGVTHREMWVSALGGKERVVSRNNVQCSLFHGLDRLWVTHTWHTDSDTWDQTHSQGFLLLLFQTLYHQQLV